MAVKDELERLAAQLKQAGLRLEASAVVEAARDAASYPALHKSLEWDDAKAGAAHRLHQAHQLIIRCRITIEDGAALGLSMIRPMRQFVHLRDETGYRPTPEVVSTDTMYEQLVMQAQADLARLMERIRALEVLQPGAAAATAPYTGGLQAWIATRQRAQQPPSQAAG